MGGDQRRLRRGGLQAQRHRPPARPPGHHRVPGSQDRCPLHPAVPGLTRYKVRCRRTGPCGVRCQQEKENDMSASPIEVVGQWLQNLLDPDVVNSAVAPDATYVSLNTEDAELSRILRWAGTSRGRRAFLDNLAKIFTRWEPQAFNVTTMFAADENVAVFG